LYKTFCTVEIYYLAMWSGPSFYQYLMKPETLDSAVKLNFRLFLRDDNMYISQLSNCTLFCRKRKSSSGKSCIGLFLLFHAQIFFGEHRQIIF
jgi:hypothetical protein